MRGELARSSLVASTRLAAVSEHATPLTPQQLEPIDPGLAVGGVRLAVSDLARSVDFYERILGLPVIARDHGVATLGAGGERAALTLEGLDEAAPVPVGSTGLFHVAWLHPTRAALADTVHRVAHARWPLEGASDHGVSEAIYLADPDGLGIEIYADRPRAQWQRTSDGGVHMFTSPLDVERIAVPIPPRTRGRRSLRAYTRRPGFEILLSPVITRSRLRPNLSSTTRVSKLSPFWTRKSRM